MYNTNEEKILEADFKISTTWIQRKIHGIAIDKRWWDEDRSDGELIALIHSELSECLESLREGNPQSEKIPYSKAEEELADVIIRILDMADARKWAIGPAIVAKIKYNKTRPFKHGKLF